MLCVLTCTTAYVEKVVLRLFVALEDAACNLIDFLQ